MVASGASTSATLWLIVWMLNNIGVTLLNKAAFASVSFHYPYFLSAIHMVCNTAGAMLIFWWIDRTKAQKKLLLENDAGSGALLDVNNNNNNKTGETLPHTESSHHSQQQQQQQQEQSTTAQGGTQQQQQQHSQAWVIQLLGDVQRKQLDVYGKRMILAFSLIFSMNIAIGNVSLKYVSVNFNQVMRSLVPAITIAMGFCLGRKTSTRRVVAVIPVIIGVAMACFGDMSYTALGFFYTVACITLAALKVVASGEMLTGPLKLHPVDLLGHMAPLAFVQCIVLAFLTGEVYEIAARWEGELSPSVDIYPMFVVWMSGLCSFSLNICSLQANKLTSPLTLCIAANVKQVLMIAASTIIFGVEISPLNGAGIVVVLIGSARYSYVSLLEKTQRVRETSATTLPTSRDNADEETGIGMIGKNNAGTSVQRTGSAGK